MKIVKTNQLKIVIFTAVKNRCISHGRVFVMIEPKDNRLCFLSNSVYRNRKIVSAERLY